MEKAYGSIERFLMSLFVKIFCSVSLHISPLHVKDCYVCKL